MKIRKYGFNINNYKNKLSRSPLNPKVLASDLHIDVNKSFKKELARKLIHLSSLWIPADLFRTAQHQHYRLFRHFRRRRYP
ncbi:MAG: hypothetical protein ACLSE6_08050 [Alphaproteobacteria bacterium]